MNNVVDNADYASVLPSLKQQLAELREQAGAASPDQVDDLSTKSEY